jgi:hypothetical protein
MTMLLQASLNILLLFLSFMGGPQDLVWFLGLVRRSIGVCDVDIDDAVNYAGPQPMNQYITLVFTSVFMEVASDGAIWVIQSTHWLGGVTGEDFGLVTNHRGDEGLGGQIAQFVLDLVVSRDHETAFLASQGMPDAKLLATAVTM